MKANLVAFFGSLFIRCLHATLRVRHVNSERLETIPQNILSFWHAHLLLMLHSRYRKPVAVLTSQSKDGEYMARVFDWYGVDCARGSSTRGASTGLRDLIRFAQNGRNIAFTPDGPKGPPRVAKDGVVYTAQATGLPIIPIAFAAQKKNSSGRGTAWSSRTRSRRRSSSTAIRSSCLARVTSRSGA